MLSRPASRCAPSVSSFQFAAWCSRQSTPAAFFATVSRPQHRRSSSKTSAPPGGSNTGSGPRAPAHATTTTRPAPSEAATEIVDRRRTPATSVGRRKQKNHEATAEDLAMKARHDAFGHIPAVPPTTHLALGGERLAGCGPCFLFG